MNAYARILGLQVLACGLLLSQGVAHAAEFRSVGVPAAVLFDGPSTKGKKLFAAPRGMPLEVVAVINQWVKVRDVAGDILWIERSDLSNQRTVIATTLATVRSSPQDSAVPVFQAERGVLLELADASAAAGWIKVKHRDGAIGYVRVQEVWGF